MFERYPIHALIEDQRERLDMRRSELVRRCGFKNVSKGIRRLDALCGGDLDNPSSRMILAALPAALEMAASVVEKAADDTRAMVVEAERKAEAQREAAWRGSFKPHAYLLGSEKRPTQLTFFGITGGAERWLKIPLDLSQPPVTFARQALAVVRKTPRVQFCGSTIGFVVNYTPDHAVRFDLDGDAVEVLDRAYIPFAVDVFIGKRKVLAGGLLGVE